jgi:hypothetical protein
LFPQFHQELTQAVFARAISAAAPVCNPVGVLDNFPGTGAEENLAKQPQSSDDS